MPNSLDYRFSGLFSNLKVCRLSLEQIKAEEKLKGKKPRVILECSTDLIVGNKRKGIQKVSADMAAILECFWRSKLSLDLYQQLQKNGLKKGSVIEVFAAIDNWQIQGGKSGIWFEFLELRKVDGRIVDFDIYKSESDSEDFAINLDSLESEINDELEELSA